MYNILAVAVVIAYSTANSLICGCALRTAAVEAAANEALLQMRAKKYRGVVTFEKIHYQKGPSFDPDPHSECFHHLCDAENAPDVLP